MSLGYLLATFNEGGEGFTVSVWTRHLRIYWFGRVYWTTFN